MEIYNRIIEDLTKFNLKGKVNSVEETQYQASGRPLNYKKIESVQFKKRITFNNIGYKLRTNFLKRGYEHSIDFTEHWNKNDVICKFNDNNKLTECYYNFNTICYKYDLNDKVIEELIYNDNILIRTCNIEYDHSGLISRKYLNNNGEKIQIDEYSYDDKGKLLEHIEFKDGICHDKTSYNYDINGRIIEVNNLSTKETYTYDNNGYIIEYIVSLQDDYKWPEVEEDDEDNFFFSKLWTDYKKYLYKNDEFGNIIEFKVFNSYFGNFLHEGNIEYVYDEKSNWIKKIEFLNGFAQCITEREILYY